MLILGGINKENDIHKLKKQYDCDCYIKIKKAFERNILNGKEVKALYLEDWRLVKDKTPDIPLTEDGDLDDDCDSIEVLVVLSDGRVTTDNFDFHTW